MSAPVYQCRPAIVMAAPKAARWSWTFDCPACCRPHYHGPLAGHRAAHCSGPEAHPNGYTLELSPEYAVPDDFDWFAPAPAGLVSR